MYLRENIRIGEISEFVKFCIKITSYKYPIILRKNVRKIRNFTEFAQITSTLSLFPE